MQGGEAALVGAGKLTRQLDCGSGLSQLPSPHPPPPEPPFPPPTHLLPSPHYRLLWGQCSVRALPPCEFAAWVAAAVAGGGAAGTRYRLRLAGGYYAGWG